MKRQRRPAPDDPQADTSLDSEHNELLERVLGRDTTVARAELARAFAANLTDEIAALEEDRCDLGSEEQLAALEASGWTPWARFFRYAAWIVALVDALLWSVGAARVLSIN